MKLTMKQMCEAIEKAGFLRKADGTAPTALEIFNYSSNGELDKIFDWYEMAVFILRDRRVDICVGSCIGDGEDKSIENEVIVKEEGEMNKISAMCTLTTPATCCHRIDGKFAWVNLCGGNSLSDEVQGCPLRKKIIITDEIPEEGTE